MMANLLILVGCYYSRSIFFVLQSISVFPTRNHPNCYSAVLIKILYLGIYLFYYCLNMNSRRGRRGFVMNYASLSHQNYSHAQMAVLLNVCALICEVLSIYKVQVARLNV
jgi:hypothetical protein